jgi:hypothetical protein
MLFSKQVSKHLVSRLKVNNSLHTVQSSVNIRFPVFIKNKIMKNLTLSSVSKVEYDLSIKNALFIT